MEVMVVVVGVGGGVDVLALSNGSWRAGGVNGKFGDQAEQRAK